MDEALGSRYWCHMCSQVVNPDPVVEMEIKCPYCESGFIEEMDGRREQETDLGSDRALSLWAPILLSMMGGGSGDGGGGNGRRAGRRESESEEEEDEESQHGRSELEADIEALIRRRRRRSSAAILHLLHGLRTGVISEPENPENEREREQDREQERVILINPFNQALILQGSFGLNQNSNQSQTQSVPGSLGDYLIGPGLDLLLQHLAENDPNRYGTPPAKKEAVEALPTVKIEDNLQCSVCLDDFEVGSEAKEMPCKHKFHDGCILPWLELHSSCPVCRFQMPASEDGSKVETDGSERSSTRVVNNNVEERSEGGDENGRSPWLPIPWPFNGLFSLSGSQNSTNSPSPPPSSSASDAAGPRNTEHRDEN